MSGDVGMLNVAGKQRGFTLIELLVVLAVIGLLLTIAVPRYFKSLDHSKEVALQYDLNTLRDVIGKFYGDKGKYPGSLEDLIDKGYLRSIPVDPITERADTWVIISPQNGEEGAVADVKSGAEGESQEGVPFDSM